MPRLSRNSFLGIISRHPQPVSVLKNHGFDGIGLYCSEHASLLRTIRPFRRQFRVLNAQVRQLVHQAPRLLATVRLRAGRHQGQHGEYYNHRRIIQYLFSFRHNASVPYIRMQRYNIVGKLPKVLP